jgi:ABC-type oligopeptide transport system substrate-binding subunit
MVKNPDYYDAAKVKLDGLNYQVVKDSQQAFMSYQNGDLDIVKLSGDQVDQVSGDPELKVVGAGYMWYLTMNAHGVPALNNANMRLAISNAVNRAAIVSDVVKDGSVATYTAVPPQFATGPDGSDFSADQTKFKDVCADDATKAAEYYAKAKEELGKDSFTFELLLEDAGSDDGRKGLDISAPPVLVELALPYLRSLDPGRAVLVRMALGHLELLRREGVIVMMPRSDSDAERCGRHGKMRLP